MAHHDRQRSVAAASSLFGAADTAPIDFFSDIQETPKETQNVDTAPAADDTSGLFSSSDTYSNDLGWNNSVGEWDLQQNNGGTYDTTGTSQDLYSSQEGNVDPYSSQAAYDGYDQQWSNYSSDSQQQQDSWSNASYPEHNQYANGTTGYEYYTSNDYQPAVTAPTTSSAHSQQTTDPYAPATATNAYTPSYDPYAPSTVKTVKPPPPPKAEPQPASMGYTYSTPQPDVGAKSAQESATTKTYRPTTYNAYDPPVLPDTGRSKKHHVHHHHPPPPPIASPYETRPTSQPPPPPPSNTYSPNRAVSPAAYGRRSAAPVSAIPSARSYNQQPSVPPPQPYSSSQYDPYAPTQLKPQVAPVQANGVYNAYAPPPASHSAEEHNYGPYSHTNETSYSTSKVQSHDPYAYAGNQAPYNPAAPADKNWYQDSTSYSGSSAASNPRSSYEQQQASQVPAPPSNATTATMDEEDFFGSSASGADDWYKDSTSTHVDTSFSPKPVDISTPAATPDIDSRMKTPPPNQYSPPKVRQSPAKVVSSPPRAYHPPKPASGYSTAVQNTPPVTALNSLPPSPTQHRTFSSQTPATQSTSATSPYPPPPPAGPRGVHARAGTPGSIKSGRVASPDVNGRRSSSTTRSSPRPDAYMPNGVTARTSSPAAHLEAARSKIASPEVALKSMTSPSFGLQSQLGASSPSDPYKPLNAALVPIPPSPMEHPRHSEAGFYTSPNPYAPSVRATPPPSSIPEPVATNDPYAPKSAASNRRQGSLASNYSVDYPTTTAPSTYTPYGSASGANSAYVPSASQTADADMLGRTSARIPVVSFGFGGKMISCLHTQMNTTGGFDVSLALRRSSPINIWNVKDLITTNIADLASPSFPGPLFSDPGSPTVNIARTAAATTKAKKGLVIKYLEERAAEIEKGLGYLSDVERPRGEAKLALVQLLKTMTEHDGKLSGTPEIESAVRAALLPRLQSAATTADAFAFSAPPIDNIALHGELGYGALAANHMDSTIASYTVTSSSLDKIQELILRGERRSAYRYALDHRMWAHAMLISSSVDKEAWKEVASEFIKTELGIDVGKNNGAVTNGRESLRVGYSLFAGNGANAVQELLPPKALSRPAGSSGSLVIPPTPNGIHNTPGLSSTPAPQHSLLPNTAVPPPEALSKWREVATTIVSNSTSGDVAALTALGDCLASGKAIEAAHVCYILAHQTSYLGGSSTSRVVLLGSENPLVKPSFHTNIDALIFSEILEFALSLTPVPKGQEPFPGLPHLQPYRLLRAIQLVEVGDITLANRYCEAIGTTLRQGKPSPYYTNTFLRQFKELSDRITAVPHFDKSGSWIARKMTKSSLEGVGNWLEGRLTKFIAGEGEEGDSAKNKDVSKGKPDASSGPFAQFSVISSANTSPTASTVNLANTLLPPKRSGSAAPLRGPFGTSNPQIDRASSAMEVRPHLAPKVPDVPQVFSAGPATTSFYSSGPTVDYGPYASNLTNAQSNLPAVELTSPGSTSPKKEVPESPVKESTYDAPSWGVSYSIPDDNSMQTPTASTYTMGVGNDDAGFLSPMDSFSLAPTPSPVAASFSSTPRSGSAAAASTIDDDDDDDLGLGNNVSKKKSAEEQNGPSSPTSPTGPVKAVPPPAKPGATPIQKPAENKSSGSWFGRLWGRTPEPNGPVKANLGEETSFYYDKELKRWVNKKGGADTTPATPPPPPPSRGPSRPQSAAPGATFSNPTGEDPRGATPPPRPSSVATSASAPPPTSSAIRNIPPKRSHLAESFVPTPEGVTPPVRPATTAGAVGAGSMDIPSTLTPPPTYGRSSAAKRKGKSRYVDVFQQEQSGAN
ncbi:hypothetical protein FRC03_005597 [Tulasnella sp. 419]|nr:hypothetical protein FRC03_005597 [Tulasnella sp. 419]